MILCYRLLWRLPFDAPMVLTLLLIGGLLSDIDHPRGPPARQSYLFKRTPRGISKFVTHRGIAHSPLAALIATAIAWVIAMFYDLKMLAVTCFFLGFISHLAADSINPTGITWLEPFTKEK